MRALYFDQTLSYRNDYPDPDDVSGEAIISVLLAGICNTDLEILRGYMSFCGVPGHEFVGRVEEASDCRLIGKRVVGEINAACGKCDFCRRGLERHCPHRTVLGILGRDGVFADYVQLPLGNLHPVPENITDEQAVFIEPIAAAVEILEQVEIAPGTPAAVLGDGKLGLLITQVLSAKGISVMLLGHHRERMERIVGDRAEVCICCDQVPDRRFPLVVEATGHPEGFQVAQRLVEPRGTLVLKSTTADMPRTNLAQLVIDEITLIGSRCGPFQPALDLLAEGRLAPERLIDARFPLEEGIEAFHRAAKSGTCKVLLRVRDE